MKIDVPMEYRRLMTTACGLDADFDALPEEVEAEFWSFKKVYDRIASMQPIGPEMLAMIVKSSGYAAANKEMYKEVPPTAAELFADGKLHHGDRITVQWRDNEDPVEAEFLKMTGDKKEVVAILDGDESQEERRIHISRVTC
jgi:hypothetical protein